MVHLKLDPSLQQEGVKTFSQIVFQCPNRSLLLNFRRFTYGQRLKDLVLLELFFWGTLLV